MGVYYYNTQKNGRKYEISWNTHAFYRCSKDRCYGKDRNCYDPQHSNANLYRGREVRKFVRKWRKGDREFTETKVWKLQKKREECPVLGCDGELIFMGYPVWVDRVDKEGDIVGGMFRMGTKTKRLEKRYCKTIKARDALVNKLVEKYSSKK